MKSTATSWHPAHHFDGRVPTTYWEGFQLFLVVAVAVHLGMNAALGLYGKVWQHASVQEARQVVVSGLLCAVVLSALFLPGQRRVPASVVVLGAAVDDTFSPNLSCTWTCAPTGTGGPAGPIAGDIHALVDIAAGGSRTYTASCTVGLATPIGTLGNTATITAPAGTTDPDTNDNSDGADVTIVPSRMVRVRAAAAASQIGGRGIAPYSWK